MKRFGRVLAIFALVGLLSPTVRAACPSMKGSNCCASMKTKAEKPKASCPTHKHASAKKDCSKQNCDLSKKDNLQPILEPKTETKPSKDDQTFFSPNFSQTLSLAFRWATGFEPAFRLAEALASPPPSRSPPSA